MPGEDSAAWDARLWAPLLVLCSALFLDGLDVSMVNVALPSIGRELDMDTGQLQWIVSGYMLGLGGFLLLGGRVADLFGRRRVFLTALAVFAVASVLGGVASDPTLLIATRFAKGLSAAFTIPAGLSILTTTYPSGPLRNKALSVWSACGASGFSLGLVIGGLLTEIGWRWTFLVPGPAALLILLAGWRTIRRDPTGHGSHRGFDVAGALTLSGGMVAFVHTVVQAPEHGWTDAQTIGGFVVAVVLLVAFVLIESRIATPLIRLGIFRSALLVRANAGAVALNGAFTAFQFIVTLYLQNLLDWSALETALGFLPLGVTVAMTAPRMGKVVDRIGAAPVVVAGFGCFILGYLVLILRIGPDSPYATATLPTMLLIGAGVALAFPALNMQATTGIADDEQGLASGLVNTSLQVGGAVVLSIVTAVVATSANGATGGTELLSAYRTGLIVVLGLAIAGLVLALTGARTRRRALV